MAPMKYQNILVVLHTRETGLRKNNSMNILLQKIAEEKAACSELQETRCKLPTSVRSTFLMSFSPDSTKVASTHGDHKIYVCDVKTGKLLHKLEGHPRTPWCLAFHPTSNDILASGCLGGEVRVWHLHGGSERWGAEHNTVITSLAFHPLDKVLVIATYNQIHFWDWSLPEPFATCRTGSEREKVRFVKFDQLGNRLITGISNLPEPCCTFPHSSGESSNTSSNSSSSNTTTASSSSNNNNNISSSNINSNNNNNNSNINSNNSSISGNATANNIGHRGYRRATLEPLPPPLVSTAGVTTVSQRRQLLARLINVYHRIRGSLFEHSRRSNQTGERPLSPSLEEALARARDYSEALSNSYALQAQQRILQGTGLAEYSERDRYRCVLHSSPSRSDYQPSFSGSELSRESTDSDEDFLVRAFWRTFHRLRFCCTSLEMRIQQLQCSAEINANMPSTSTSLPQQRPTYVEPMEDPPPNSSGNANNGTNYLQMTSEFLMSTLTRFQNSLQFSAVSGAVAQDQIQQVQGRISEILERLNNVTGYRARLNTLRDQIYEVAERNEGSGDEQPYVRSSDLAHCLWLIEMSLQLTQHLQRILHADYRLTQLHMNSPSQPPSMNTSPPTSNNNYNINNNMRPPLGNSYAPRSCVICGNQSQTIPIDSNTAEEFQQAWDRLRVHVRQELEAATERIRNNTTTSGAQSLSAVNEGRLFRILSSINVEEEANARSNNRTSRDRQSEILDEGAVLARLRTRLLDLFTGESNAAAAATTAAAGQSPPSAHSGATSGGLPTYEPRGYQNLERTFSDNSDDDDYVNSIHSRYGLNASEWQTVYNALESYRNRRWNTARQAVANLASVVRSSQQSNFHLPEVNIVPSSSANDADPLPVHERPLSPPLPTILSGAGDHMVSSWFSAVRDMSASHFLGSHETVVNYSHRVQSWDFSRFEVPEISNAKVNLVVPKCKIHNDASIDISKDGELLVALVPSSGTSLDSMMFAVYSLNPKNLGHCLYNWSFDSNAISVSFSPLGQYIVIGLASPRLYLSSSEKEAVAQIFKLKFADDSCVATHVRSLTQQGTGNTHHPGVSLNSVQWLPQPGQGLIYGTNRGCLSICKPVAPMSKNSNKNLKVSRSYEIGTLRDVSVRRRSLMQFHRMLSAATQTIERGTQTTGTQTLGSDGSSSSSSR